MTLDDEVEVTRERLREHLSPIEDDVFDKVWSIVFEFGMDVQSLWLIIESDETSINILLDACRKLMSGDDLEGALADWAMAKHLLAVTAGAKAKVLEQRDRAVLESWT